MQRVLSKSRNDGNEREAESGVLSILSSHLDLTTAGYQNPIALSPYASQDELLRRAKARLWARRHPLPESMEPLITRLIGLHSSGLRTFFRRTRGQH